MGFLDIFRKREAGPEIDDSLHSIPLWELPSWMEEQFGDELGRNKKLATKIHSDIIGAASDVRDMAMRLEKSKTCGSDRVNTMANMAKDSFVKKTLSTMRSIKPSECDCSYTSLKNLSSDVSGVIREISSASPKQLFMLSKYFNEDSTKFMNSLKKLEHKNAELSEFLKSGGIILKLSSDTERTLGRMRSMVDEMKEKRGDEERIKARIDELDREKKKAKQDMESLLSGKEWMEMKKQEQEEASIEREMSEIASEANQLLNPSRRPLKKLKHTLGSNKKLPDDLFMDVVMAGRTEWLRGMLEKAVEKEQEGELNLKKSDSDKIRDVLSGLDSIIPKLTGRYEKLRTALGGEGSKMKSELSARKEETERKIADLESELRREWEELDNIKKEIRGLESSMMASKGKIEKEVKEKGGKRLELKMPKDKI
ncbi:MAG: hypothetical protein DRO99_00685 [Candidatus Aenigmatarchaeota archaeon]|nr:MAG: hypothetical protein DRO99_00685 [Candidatus Aenigmarchaeota archaeon]